MAFPCSRAFSLCFLSVALAGSLSAQSSSDKQTVDIRRSQALDNYLRMPLAFEKQSAGNAEKFVARGQGYTIGLQGSKATISAGKNRPVTLGFSGGAASRGVANGELPGKVNYIHGNDPRQWRMGETAFGRVTYPNVYPGVDVVYYGNQQQLEFDLVLKQGADPRAIRLKVDGASDLSIDASGSLRLGEGGLEIALPKIYQEVNGTRKPVAGRYALRGRNEVAFRLDAYDRSKPLVIDPTIVYSTVVGGNSTTIAFGVAVDSSGNAYIAGYTNATDFPTVNAVQTGLSVASDGFVAKMNAAGTALLYSTYIGGNNTDEFLGIAVDANGNAWAGGYTFSPDFPTLGAVQSTYGGNGDAMLVQLSSSGALQFSTFLGTGGNEEGFGVAVDASNNAYVTGYASGAFPTTTGVFQSTNSGDNDVFVAKFSSTGAEVYSTLLGGAGSDIGNAIATDASGNAYVAGQTESAAFTGAPTGGAQTTYAGSTDGFVAKLNAAGTQMTYFTFLGGSGGDAINALAVDASGNAFVGGVTESTDLVTAGTLQIPYGGGEDGFVGELNPAGTAFTWLSYLGGNRTDVLRGLAVDGAGSVYATGYSNSANLAVSAAVQPAPAGNTVSLFHSTDGGVTWTAADATAPGQVFDLLPDPANAGTIVATTEDGLARTTNGGTSWSVIIPFINNGTGGSGFYGTRSPVDGKTIYATQGGGFASSGDGGVTWNIGLTGGVPFTPAGIVADPLSASTVYTFAVGGGVFKSTDGGNSFGPAVTGLPNLSVEVLAAGPDGALYAGLSGNGFYKSVNQGGNWSAINTGLPSGFTPAAHSISVSATAANTAYATANGSVYTTTNGGSSWTRLTSFPSTGAGMVAVSPLSATNVYVGTNTEVFTSTDGGTTWTEAGGVSATGLTEIVFDAATAGHAYITAFVSYSAFVAKLDPTKSAPTWLTYLGGPSSNTLAYGVATDGKGDAFVAGYRNGYAFPTSTMATDPAPINGTSAYLTEISDATASCSVALMSPATTVVTGSAQAFPIVIEAPSGCAWTASSNQTWATLSAAGGTGTGSVFLQVAQNTSGAARSVTVTIGSQTYSITQADFSCTYSLSASSLSIGNAGGSLSDNLTTGAGCPWAIFNTYGNAVTVTSATSGTGSATVTFNVAPSTDLNARSLSLTIGVPAVTISQPGLCTFSISPTSATYGAGAATGSVTVTASATGCTWSESGNVSGLSVTSGNSYTGTASVNYSIAANTGDARSGQLNIAGKAFIVSQAGLTPAYLTSTIAGGLQPTPAVNALAAAIPYPTGVAFDPAGNAYIVTQAGAALYELSAAGVLTRVAGNGFNGFAGDGGLAINSQLSNPLGVAIDKSGNIYIADSGNNRIRMINTSGVISTIAGTGTNNFSGDGGAATSAALSNPSGIAIDGSGNIYIADQNNQRVRKVSGGTINTVAGNGTGAYAGDGGAATSAELWNPYAVAVDSSGNLFIADSTNNRVREVSGGNISTFAGNGSCCFSGDGGTATSAMINNPHGLAVDAAGNLYISDSNNNRIRIVTTNGVIATVVGGGGYGALGDGGPATSAQLRTQQGIALDASGNLWIADTSNQRVRMVAGGMINLVAGGGSLGLTGPAILSGLAGPSSVVKDGSGNIYIADEWNNLVRKIAPDGTTSVVAGTGVQGYSGDTGPATSAKLNQPTVLAFDTSGNLYIADSQNYRIRKIDGSGNISTVVGSGTCCYSGDGGTATSAQINSVQGLLVDGSGNIYISDSSNHRVRKVTGGTITTIAGTGSSGFSGDSGPATAAQLNNPDALALDSSGNLYIADSSNRRVRKITGTTISTYAGNGNFGTAGDGGPATSAQLNTPRGLAMDSANNLYITDNATQRVREVLANGTMATVAGNGGYSNSGDGGAAISANFRSPSALTVDSAGDIYVADSNNNSVRLLTPVATTPVLTVASSHTGSFNGTGSYTVTVTNAPAAGTTSGTVTVTDVLPQGLTLNGANAMSGNGWTCATNSCTRSDALGAAASYPAISVAVTVSGSAPLQVTNQVTVSGGGAAATGANDFTLITPIAPSAPVLTSPADSATNISVVPTLTWNASPEATSYDVYFGAGTTTALVGTTTGTTFVPATVASPLTVGSVYSWQVVAKNSVGTNGSSVFSFTTYPNGYCTYALSIAAASFGSAAGTGSVGITAPAGCAWAVQSSQTWLSLTSDPAGSGNGTLNYSMAPNTGAARSTTLTVGGQTFTVTQSGYYLISTLAGGEAPLVTAPGNSLALASVTGVASDSVGNTYIAEPEFNAVYRLDAGGVLSLFAGTGVQGYSGDTGAALSAMLNQPQGVAVDALGDVFIADSGNNRIRQVSPSGTIVTVAGTGNCCYAGDGGPATSAWLNYPFAVAVDASGNLYIADTNNHRVRKVTGGTITTIAGNGNFGYSGDGAAATSAQLNSPEGVAVDGSGNVYIGDRNNNRVRKVSGGTITTFAGNNSCCNVNDGGPAVNAWLASPQGVAVDGSGNVYIADSNNNRIREVSTNGNIQTVAGIGNGGFSADGILAVNSLLRTPAAVALDFSGNLIIADQYNQRVRKVSAGVINTIAGGGNTGDEGFAALAAMNLPAGIAKDGSGNIFIADETANRVRKIAANGLISTLAGDLLGQLDQPQAVTTDTSGNVYIYDANHNRIVKVDTGGNMTTVAGNGSCCYSGDGGAPTSAQISYGYGVAVDGAGNIYIADSNNNRIRKVSGGTITTIAGTGVKGYSGDGSPAVSAQLSSPAGIAVDASGNVYFADSGNQRIRKISGNTITTVAGNGNCCFAGDGGLATSAQLNNPRSVGLDAAGNLYIVDGSDNRVREVAAATGTIFTIAGNGGYNYSGDGGNAVNATFRTPQGIAIDTAGDIYVADTFNSAVRQLTPAGTSPVLSIASAHSGNFTAGGTGTYTLTVSNAALAGATSGTVRVAELLPSGLTLGSLSGGSAWTCGGNSCTNTAALNAGSSYPAITVSVNVSGTVPLQVTNQVVVWGDSAAAASNEDLTLITPVAPGVPLLTAPANAATNVSTTPMLTWSAATEATSYDVYLGTAATPPLVANTTGLSYTMPALANNQAYNWQVVAKNSAGSTPSLVFSFTTIDVGFCTYSLTPTAASFSAAGGTGSVAVTAPSVCPWTVLSSQSWLGVTSAASGSGNATINYSVAGNSGGPRSATLTIGGQTLTVTQNPAYLISTIAGGKAPAVLASATSAVLAPTTGVAIDSAGNTYIAQPVLNVVYKRDSSGVLSVLAGNGVQGYSGDGGYATSAMLNQPQGVAVDSAGDIFIADSGNNRIRKVTPAGVIFTVAGTGTCCYAGDGGPATSAMLNYPIAVTVDPTNDLYIADTNNHRIRKVTGGIITTVAGNGINGFSGDGGAATSAQLNSPQGVAVDSSGNIYIGDHNNNRVREVSAGNITTLAGTNVCCTLNDGAAATGAWLASPQGVAVDASGNVYIADANNQRIREVTSDGNIHTVAGSGGYGFFGDGGAATSAQLRTPAAVAFDSDGNMLIADQYNGRIRKVTGGNIATVAGGGPNGDGAAAALASIGLPTGAVKDSSGNIYVLDTVSSIVRKISPTGIITTAAGTGVQGYSGDSGPAASAMLSLPQAIALDASGNLYIYDAGNARIREVDGSGNISTVAGNGSGGYSGDGGSPTSAQIGYGYGLAVDGSGNIYIADSNNQRIREVSGGKINTIAGTGVAGYSGDGAAATSAKINFPQSVAVDGSGNVYITDTNNQRIREISGGNITTLAGNGSNGFSGDGGAAINSQVNYPHGIAVDSTGNVYFDDSNDHRIREITGGTIFTIAGNGGYNYAGDGGNAVNANFRTPQSVSLDSSGNIYISDTFNESVRQLTPAGTSPVLTISSAHGAFTVGGTGTYTLTVANAAQAGPTSGTVTVTANLPAGLTLNSMGGASWGCTANVCTRSDVLNGGNPYPAITVSVAISDTAPVQITLSATVTGGGAPSAAVEDFTVVALLAQSIQFSAVPTQIIGDPAFNLTATASSGLAVQYVSNSTGICTVSGATVTLVSGGTCSITATQAGNGTYAAAPAVTVTFTVDAAFADLTDQNASTQTAINLMASYGITSGCLATPFEYCPDLVVTRAQMAVFIIRGIYGSNNFTYTTTPYFTDVPATAQFFKYIQKMKDLGITNGATATTYAPDASVTRGQMAVFIVRARLGSSVVFNYTATPYFTDVPLGAQFFNYIQKMKDIGITAGTGPNTYSPNAVVTRGQMAVFVMRGAFNLLLPVSAPAISAVSPTTGSAGTTVTVTLTGKNTSFAQGTTTVSAGTAITVQNVTVNSATSLTAQLVIPSGATLGPVSIMAITGTQEAVLPNGFTITSDPAVGAIAYWSGNGTTANAISTQNAALVNGATYASAASRTAGRADAQAFSLNGTNSYVQAGSTESAAVSGARTLVAWVYPNTTTGLGMPILVGGASLAGDMFGITGTTGNCNGQGQFRLYIDHWGTSCYISDIALTPNAWSMVAVTFDGASAVFYINGVASVSIPAKMYAYNLSTYTIGGDTIGGSTTAASFNGSMGEVQIYGRALTPQEIQGIYAP